MERISGNGAGGFSGKTQAFTLVEVIVALGIVAVSVTSLIAFVAAVARVPEDTLRRSRAVHLAGALEQEVVRLMESQATETGMPNLEALAAIVPAAEEASALRLVGSADGMRVIRESEVDDPVVGVAAAERFFLVEVRRQAGSLAVSPTAGFLALSAAVRWPYPTNTRTTSLRPVVINLVLRP